MTLFQRLYADIEEVAWPGTLSGAEIERLPSGSLRLLSHDEYASMTIPPHKQDFTVEYLAKVSQPSHRTAAIGMSHSIIKFYMLELLLICYVLFFVVFFQKSV